MTDLGPTAQSLELSTVPGDDWSAAASLGLGAHMGRYRLVRLVGSGGMGMVFEAHDPELDRTVAVKILRAARADADAQLLRREGQTMARLTHGNVIRVYDVGVDHGHVFVAMEFVAGTTLGQWLTRAPRTPEAIIATFVRAGHGLAAAHAAGLVHRDVKPGNVLVGDDGRVLVTDFGLARSAGDADEHLLAAGTPAYMAPEQRRGVAADARADQYSFAVALWRALFADVEVGAATPAAVRIAPAARAALVRGASTEPADRFATLDELLAALTPPPPRRGWWIAGGGVAIAAAALLGLGLAPRSSAAVDPCPPPTAPVASVWTAARAGQVRARLAAIDPERGAVRDEIAARMIERYLTAWSAMRVGVCQANRVHGDESDTMFDLRTGCLDRRLTELGTSVDLLASAPDAAALDAALTSILQVTPVDSCGRADAASEPARPDGAGPRAIADALAPRIQRVELDARADRVAELPARARAIVDAARGLGHAPTLASALTAQARAELAVDHHEAAEAVLRELTQVAATGHDDRDEAFAWTSLIAVIGSQRGRTDEALALVPAAQAAVKRAGAPLALRVELLHAEGNVLVETPRVADALARLGEARALLADAGATRAESPLAVPQIVIVSDLCAAQSRAGDQAAAAATCRDAIDQWRGLLGPDSVAEARSTSELAQCLRRDGKLDEAEAAYREAARIAGLRGARALLATCTAGLATVEGDRGAWDRALVSYDRALEIGRAALGPDDLALAAPLLGRANALSNLERLDDADQSYADAIALYARAGAADLNLAIIHYNRGELATRRLDGDTALEAYRHATAVFEAHGQAGSAYLIYPLVGEGRTLVMTDHPLDAIAPLQRAAALDGEGNDAVQMAFAEEWLGRALVESGRDRAYGLRTVKHARASYVELLAAHPDLANLHVALRVVDKWLASAR